MTSAENRSDQGIWEHRNHGGVGIHEKKRADGAEPRQGDSPTAQRPLARHAKVLRGQSLLLSIILVRLTSRICRPIPVTLSNSSSDSNEPYSLRYSTMA